MLLPAGEVRDVGVICIFPKDDHSKDEGFAAHDLRRAKPPIKSPVPIFDFSSPPRDGRGEVLPIVGLSFIR